MSYVSGWRFWYWTCLIRRIWAWFCQRRAARGVWTDLDGRATRRQQLQAWWRSAYLIDVASRRQTAWAVPFPPLHDHFARLMVEWRGEQEVWSAEGRRQGRVDVLRATGRSPVEAMEQLYLALQSVALTA